MALIYNFGVYRSVLFQTSRRTTAQVYFSRMRNGLLIAWCGIKNRLGTGDRCAVAIVHSMLSTSAENHKMEAKGEGKSRDSAFVLLTLIL